MSADVKLATMDLRLWSGGCGFAGERILKDDMYRDPLRLKHG
jgi:hypothetical protein